MKKIELEAKRERKRRFTFLVSLIIVVSVVLSLVQVGLSNRLASQSEELAKLEVEEVHFLHENELLQKEVASASAISTLAQKAHLLSLREAPTVLVIEEAEARFAHLLGKDGF